MIICENVIARRSPAATDAAISAAQWHKESPFDCAQGDVVRAAKPWRPFMDCAWLYVLVHHVDTGGDEGVCRPQDCHTGRGLVKGRRSREAHALVNIIYLMGRYSEPK